MTTIAEHIEAGRCDLQLEEINRAIRNRMRATGQMAQEIQVGDQVRLTRIKPRYLVGKEVTVLKVNTKTIGANIPNHASFGVWAGRQGVRIPKSCIERV